MMNTSKLPSLKGSFTPMSEKPVKNGFTPITEQISVMKPTPDSDYLAF